MKRNPTRRFTVMGVAVVAAMAVPFAAHAAPLFNDVGESHPFYDEIQWMGATGVSTGYDDGSYRPSDPVTRQAMSAFMQRLYDVQEDMGWNTGVAIVQTDSTSFVDVPGAVVQVSVPDGVYANLSARFTAESYCSGEADAWCSVRLVVSEDGGPFEEMYPVAGLNYAFDAPGDANGTGDNWEGHALERLGFGSPGSDYTIKAQFAVSSVAVNYLDDWAIVAETDLQASDYVPL